MNRWAENELKTCLELLKSGLDYSQISDILNKTESSIRSKLNKIGEKSSNYAHLKFKITNCLECQSEIKHINSTIRVFCSQSCSASYNNRNRKNTLNKCLNCFSEVKKRNKYCSNKCQSEHERSQVFEKIENGDTSLYEKNYKNYLIHIHGEKCMKCGWSERHSMTNKVPIQLEHKDGNSQNNSLDNLELLCPNCHSLTETFGALNKGNGRKNRKR
jgi:hypothetical protein